MAIRFNPLIFSGFDLTGGVGTVYWAPPVATENDLPVPGGQNGEVRVVQDTDKIYIWDATTSKWIDTGITLAAFGGTSAEGLTTSTSTTGDITRRTLQLNEASSATPGAVSTGTQNFAGEKTFDDLATASSGVETDSIDSIAGGSGVLSVGVSNASTINIGDTGVNVNLYGNTFYQEVTNLEVTDKQVTLNKNGAPASAFNSGIELEEGGSITGYVSTSGDRASWELKPPGVAGTATISPGAAGITIDQSSHDPVTLGAVGSSPNPDAATLTNQVLNLEPADATNPGVITATAQTIGGDKTFTGDISANNLSGTNSGDVTLAAVGSSPNSNGATLTGQQLNLEPADATNPGVITAGTQTLGGAKTLVDELTASGGIYYSPADPTDWAAPAPAQIAPAIDELASRFTNQNAVTNEPTGFPDRTHSEILINDNAGDPIFTIQPKAPYTSFDVYIKGNKFTKSAAETVTSVSHPGFPHSGNNYFYYDQNGALQVTNVFSAAIIQEYAFISIVYWNPETNLHTYFAEERHGLTMDGVTHSYLHTVFGARYLSGLALQNFTVGTGGLNADAQFDVDQGQIRDEDILISIAAEAQIPILYRQNQLWRKKTADAFPVIYSGTAGYTGASGRLPYNQYTGGAWQLTEVQNNKYVLCHFFATNDKENGVVGIQGVAQYDSLEAARTAANTEITGLGGLPFAEFVPIGTVVFQTSNTMANTPKADVIPIDGANYIDFRGTQLYTPAGEATTHGLLSGLANDDHQQYLLVDGSRAMTGDLDMGSLYQIKNLAAGTVSTDAVNLSQLTDAITDTPATFAGFNDSGVLAPVPGWTFDDIGGTQIGAQNSLVVPPGTTDFTTLSISSGISNTGLNNYSAIQLNPSIDQPVTNFTMFQSYGYGASAPTNYTTIQSQPGFSGTASNLIHFSVDGSANSTTIIGYNYFPSGDSTSETAFQASSSGNTTNYVGVSISPTGTSTNFTAFNSTPLGNTDIYTGVNVAPQNSGTSYTGVKVDGNSTYTNVTGVEVDLSNITSPNRKTGLSVNDGVVQQNASFTTTSGVGVDTGNLLRPVLTIENGSPITGTDVLMNNLAGFVQLDDAYSASPLNLGISSVGFVSQLSGSLSGTADTVSMLTTGFAVDTGSTGGTIDEAHLIKGVTFNFGGTLTINNLYGFRLDPSISNVATNTWGISVEDPNAENYLAKSLVIGGASKTVGNPDVALEIQEPKSLTLGNATTVERTALSNYPGSLVYDTDTAKPYYNDGTQWVEIGSGAASGVTQIVAGTNVTISPPGGTGVVTINASGGGGLQTGDIAQTVFTALDNQNVPVNVTGFTFSNSVTRAFEAIVGISRGSTYAEYSLRGIQKAASWDLGADYIGDDVGITFSITSSGQIQYTSTSTGNTAKISFRADTVPVDAVVPPSNYQTEVLADSPVIYYRFQETSGTAIADSSGNNNYSTVNLGVGGLLDQLGPFAGSKSIYFDGSSTKVTTNQTHPSQGPYSIEFWFKTSATQNASMVSHQTTSPAAWTPEVNIIDNANQTYVVSYAYPNGLTAVTTASAGYNDGQWHHVVATVGPANNHSIYMDGVLSFSSGNSVAGNYNLLWIIGQSSGQLSYTYFQGNITEVAIYDTELSAARIAAHYAAANVTPPLSYQGEVLADSPVVYYRFQETSGTTIADSSGNNQNATLTLGTGLLNQSGIDGGKSILFDGSVTKVASNSQIPSGSPFSLEFWFKTSTPGPIGLVSHNTGSSSWTPEVTLVLQNRVRSYVFGNSTNTVDSVLQNYNDNQWHHVVVTVGPSNNHSLYIDGSLDTTTGNSSAYAFLAFWVIGEDHVGTKFQGNITEFAIYDTELSAARIAAHYAAANITPPVSYQAEVLADTPWLYWELNDPVSSSTVVDSSGNGRTGDAASVYGVVPATFGIPGKVSTAALVVPVIGSPVSSMIKTTASTSWFAPTYVGPVSVEFWVKTPGTDTSIISFSDLSLSGIIPFEISVDVGGQIRATGQSGPVIVGFGPVINDINWHHVVLTYDNAAPTDNVVLYIDGVSVGTTNNSISWASPPCFWSIGNTVYAGTSSVEVDEFAVYDYVLSAARVLAHYNAAP